MISRNYNILCYGSEVWTLQQQKNTIAACEIKFMQLQKATLSRPREGKKKLLVVCKVGLKTIILRGNVIRKH